MRLYSGGDISLDSVSGGAGGAKITGAGGTVSNGDDIVVVLDGVNGEVFVAGTSIGTTATIDDSKGTIFLTTEVNAGMKCDHVACFPRDVSPLLPKGTY